MANNDDLTRTSDAELVRAYVENVQTYDAIEHVGAKNRHMTRRYRIVDELAARSGGALAPLRGLLDHADPKVRHVAAIHFRTIDHAAFERTVGALAQRTDEIGRDARSSLEIDAHFQKVGYPENEKREARSARERSKEFRWQVDNIPPAAMTGVEIVRRLRDALPAVAERLIQLALPAIGLWPQRPRADAPIGLSRLGGMPEAPPNWSWPMVGDEPMLFVGQINCATVNALPGTEILPDTGLLAFFGDHDAVMACAFGGGDVAVYHWADIDRLRPAAPPIEPAKVFPSCSLLFRPVIDLPDPRSHAVGCLIKDKEQIARYSQLYDLVRGHGIPEDVRRYCSFGKLFGWPRLVQHYDLDSLRHESEIRLLLQIDDYSNGDETQGWGPGGSLYFLMRDDDLRERHFDQCQFEIQFT